jgi:hypothetical protein
MATWCIGSAEMGLMLTYRWKKLGEQSQTIKLKKMIKKKNKIDRAKINKNKK